VGKTSHWPDTAIGVAGQSLLAWGNPLLSGQFVRFAPAAFCEIAILSC